MKKGLLIIGIFVLVTILITLLIVSIFSNPSNVITANTPEEIYKHIISQNISDKIDKILATGYTFQGHLLYLVIEFNDKTYIDELKKTHDYKIIDCKKIISALTIPEDLKDKLKEWQIPQNLDELSCYRASGYSNNWTSNGESIFFVNTNKVFFYEIGI